MREVRFTEEQMVAIMREADREPVRDQRTDGSTSRSAVETSACAIRYRSAPI
jgi:hypothetical protein